MPVSTSTETVEFTIEFEDSTWSYTSSTTTSSAITATTVLPETTTDNITDPPPNEGLTGGQIAGICVLVLIVLVGVILLVIFIIKRNRPDNKRTALPAVHELYEIEQSNRYDNTPSNKQTSPGYTNDACSSPEDKHRKISLQPVPITYNEDDDQLDVIVEPPTDRPDPKENYDTPKHHFGAEIPVEEYDDEDDPELYKVVPTNRGSVKVMTPSNEQEYQNVAQVSSRTHHKPPPPIAKLNTDGLGTYASTYANLPPEPVPHKQGKKKPRYVNVDDNENNTNTAGHNAYLQQVSPPKDSDNTPESPSHDYVNENIFMQHNDVKSNNVINQQGEPEIISNGSSDSHEYVNNPVIMQQNIPTPPPKQKRHGHVNTPRKQPNDGFGMEMMGDRTS